QISALNDELDANASHQELLEDALDMRTQQLFHLQKALMLHTGDGGAEGGSERSPPTQTIGGWRAGPASPAQPSPPAAIHRPSTAPHPNPNPAESLRQKAVAHHAPSPEASSSNLTTSRHAPANSSVPDVVARVNGVATVEPKLVAPLGSHRLLEEDLVTCRRFKPHALMQPTLFSTGTAASAAGGIALPEGVSIGGGEGRGEDTALGVGGGRHGSVRDGQGSGAGQGEGGIRLLNAWEKIEELEGLVESSRSHNERLLEDLEEVQTDKVSMEYLLREKLERLVQSEIEARVARMHQDGGVDAILRRQLDGLRVEAAARARSEAALRTEVQRLRRSLSARQPNQPPQASEQKDFPEDHIKSVNDELVELRIENSRLRTQAQMPGANVGVDESSGASGRGHPGHKSARPNTTAEVLLQDRCEALLGERKAMQ
ncbi:unnamed protein product, partial [Sphacelaria rigidula]